jgi:hypothetical protein
MVMRLLASGIVVLGVDEDAPAVVGGDLAVLHQQILDRYVDAAGTTVILRFWIVSGDLRPAALSPTRS